MSAKQLRPAVAMGNRSWVSAYSSAPAAAEPEPKQEVEAQPISAANKTQPTKEGNTSMKKEKKVKAPKAAKAKAPKQRKGNVKAKKAATASNGTHERYNKIMGFSVCSVVRRLGMDNVSFGHAEAILAANGVKAMPPKSLRVQLWYGSVGQRGVAELTKEQVAELKASAPEPIIEEKAA